MIVGDIPVPICRVFFFVGLSVTLLTKQLANVRLSDTPLDAFRMAARAPAHGKLYIRP